MKQETHAQFKCSFKPNTQDLVASCRRMVFNLTDAQAIGLFFSIFVLLGLTVVPQIAAGKGGLNADNATLFWALVVIFFLMILIYFILPAIYARATLDNLKQGKGNATIYMDFYDDNVHLRNSAVTGKNVLPYDYFVRCAETAELLLLQNAKHQVLILPKANLTGATVDECKKFFQNHCAKAKIRWRRVL